MSQEYFDSNLTYISRISELKVIPQKMTETSREKETEKNGRRRKKKKENGEREVDDRIVDKRESRVYMTITLARVNIFHFGSIRVLCAVLCSLYPVNSVSLFFSVCLSLFLTVSRSLSSSGYILVCDLCQNFVTKYLS